jgi:hypothetical protein
MQDVINNNNCEVLQTGWDNHLSSEYQATDRTCGYIRCKVSRSVPISAPFSWDNNLLPDNIFRVQARACGHMKNSADGLLHLPDAMP